MSIVGGLHLRAYRLLDAARHLTGAKVLAARLYGVMPAGPADGHSQRRLSAVFRIQIL